MKKFITMAIVLWAFIVFAFFLGNGANTNMSEWDKDSLVILTFVLITTLPIIAMTCDDYY